MDEVRAACMAGMGGSGSWGYLAGEREVRQRVRSRMHAGDPHLDASMGRAGARELPRECGLAGRAAAFPCTIGEEAAATMCTGAAALRRSSIGPDPQGARSVSMATFLG